MSTLAGMVCEILSEKWHDAPSGIPEASSFSAVSGQCHLAGASTALSSPLPITKGAKTFSTFRIILLRFYLAYLS